MIPNLHLIPDRIVVLTSPRNIILINLSVIFWSNTNKVICPIGSLYPPEEEEAICMMKPLPFLAAIMTMSYIL